MDRFQKTEPMDDDLRHIEACKAACTCPRSGPKQPSVGLVWQPAIIVGHQPRCPALELIWTRRERRCTCGLDREMARGSRGLQHAVGCPAASPPAQAIEALNESAILDELESWLESERVFYYQNRHAQEWLPHVLAKIRQLRGRPDPARNEASGETTKNT